MKHYSRINLNNAAAIAILLIIMGCDNGAQISKDSRVERSVQIPLNHQDSNIIKTSWPSIGCWFWQKEEFTGDGYKKFIDLHEQYSPFKLLTTSLRYPGDLTDPEVYKQIKAASLYAREKGMAIVMDLDIRLARDSFREKYPGELQQIVFIKEFPLNKKDLPSIGVKGHGFGDHYTYGRTPYDVVSAKLLRVYSYQKKNGLIKSGTVKDISGKAVAVESQDSVHVSINGAIEDAATTACALVAFTVNTPDVFAPHLLSYQREILQQYADASLAGACKDEWGFPGRFTTPTDELWYSAGMAKVYAQRNSGRDLLRDMLLMSMGETGYEAERVGAVNNYMEMYSTRNGEIETDYYHAIKEILGKDAMSGTHPTWFPYPDNREIFKNGLSWWTSKRDLAQTDEATPFSVRTSLSKKMYSPLWFNMYYDKTIKPYYKDIWRAALAGGRLNYHPLWPVPIEQMQTSLLKDSVMLVESRISLLNYISETPPDCQVAVVFGHPAALNWTDTSNFADVGLNVANALWKAGYYADLIPSSEIVNGSLIINENGKVQYGLQQYEAVIFYHPQYDKQSVAAFFRKAGEAGKTALFRVGNWTVDFNAEPFDGNSAMGIAATDAGATSVVGLVTDVLKSKSVPVQTEGEEHTVSAFPASVMPKAAGQLTLIDGTRIFISGERHPLGDTIQRKINIDGQQANVDAIGVTGIRMNAEGEVEALACGGLKTFQGGSLNIHLESRVDVALIKRSGKWKGIIHSNSAEIPAPLLDITRDWTIVRVPPILKD
ncbi:hypothetical protein [Agriterribacter sp.]|uniref:hypothetical protein n=1 Tax=Agriterribacter sp. TaxID=2821509 RepID=UPI002B88EEFD|nr:hypothetical protein [Agriterribacter sp.]HRP55464.1 hypothetical protein [Agriterribacter sp.]